MSSSPSFSSAPSSDVDPSSTEPESTSDSASDSQPASETELAELVESEGGRFQVWGLSEDLNEDDGDEDGDCDLIIEEERDEADYQATAKDPHPDSPDLYAIERIKRFQESTEVLIPTKPFKRLVREIVQDMGVSDDFALTESAVEALQAASEAYIVDLYTNANFMSVAFGSDHVLRPLHLQT